jgi:hypothetical protein
MKTIKLSLGLGFLMLSTLVFGQDYAFKVLANKGTNEVKSGDAWQPLKTGASLKKTDELKLGDNSYIGLVHASGKPVELKQAGTHKVSEIEQKLGTGSSVLNKYTDFILSSNSAESKKNKLSATGAVHRGPVGETASAIKLLLPESQHTGIFNSQAVINWEGGNGPYIVILRDMFEDELARIETPENSIKVDLTNPKYAASNAIFVEVSAKADPKVVSKRHLIKKLPQGEHDNVKNSLNEIMGEVSEQNALNKYIMAGFYEEHNLFIDAIAAYEEAIRLAPDVPTYKEAYDDFLLRHGLKQQ